MHTYCSQHTHTHSLGHCGRGGRGAAPYLDSSEDGHSRCLPPDRQLVDKRKRLSHPEKHLVFTFIDEASRPAWGRKGKGGTQQGYDAALVRGLAGHIKDLCSVRDQ